MLTILIVIIVLSCLGGGYYYGPWRGNVVDPNSPQPVAVGSPIMAPGNLVGILITVLVIGLLLHLLGIY